MCFHSRIRRFWAQKSVFPYFYFSAIQYPTEPLRFDRYTEQTKVIREDDKWRQGVGALHITLIEFRKFVFIAPIVKVLNQGTNQCQSEEQGCVHLNANCMFY